MTGYTIVIPTTGRENLYALLDDLRRGEDAQSQEIIVVDDRRDGTDLALDGVRVLR